MQRPCLLFMLLWLTLATAVRAEPRVIADISERRVDIAYRFAGADLLLFGAGLGLPQNARTDVVVVVRGPNKPLIVRRKSRVLGLWINTAATDFRTAPTFYALSSNRELEAITSPEWRAIYELGIESLHFSPVTSGAQSSVETGAFRDGFIALRRKLALFSEDYHGVEVIENSLFRCRLRLPPRVPVGDYVIEIYVFADQKLLARQVIPFVVNRSGFERRLFNFAHRQRLLYGLAAVAFALMLGWLAAMIASRIRPG